MTSLNKNTEHNNLYGLGVNTGYFMAFLLFASAFYFVLRFLHKIPQAIKYYHVLFFVIIAYIIRFTALKLKK